MWTENRIFREDLERLAGVEYIPWDVLKGKRVLVTGATGLIGYNFVSALLYYGKTRSADIQVIALVRDIQKAKEKFRYQIADGCRLELLQGDVLGLPEVKGVVDYIVHGASPTASAYFVKKPVETIATAVLGTKNVLNLAKEKKVSGVVYLSSMEVYGKVMSEEAQEETDLGYIDLFSLRSSYSESKRMAENLCYAFAGEYAVPVTVARLAQTFGPGVSPSDERVFAYAARCALMGKDILLKTSGTKKNMYLYTMDAVSAILLLMAEGERGTAYNVGNPNTFCTVKEMVRTAAQALCSGKSTVLTSTDLKAGGLYPPEGCLKMDVSKLKKLGWNQSIDLSQMFARMVAGFDMKDLEDVL